MCARRIERVSFLAFRTKDIQAVEIEACCIFDRVAARFLSQLTGLDQRGGKLSGGKSIVINHVLSSLSMDDGDPQALPEIIGP